MSCTYYGVREQPDEQARGALRREGITGRDSFIKRTPSACID